MAQPSGEANCYLRGKVICMLFGCVGDVCLCYWDKWEPRPTTKWFAMCFKCVWGENFMTMETTFLIIEQRMNSFFQLLSVHLCVSTGVRWFYISWERSCPATNPSQAQREVKGPSPNSLFFFVCPLSFLSKPPLPKFSNTLVLPYSLFPPPLISNYLHPTHWGPPLPVHIRLNVAIFTNSLPHFLLFHFSIDFCPVLPTADPDVASLLLFFLCFSWP